MEEHETVIVGAGPGGLKAAEVLAKAGREVLVLEQNKIIGDKVCGGLLSLKDFELGIPEKIVDRKFKKIVFHTPYQTTEMKDKKFFLATIDRKVLGKWMEKQTEKAGAKIWANTRVDKIGKNFVSVGKKKIGFKYLIGADGTNSIVKKYLGISKSRPGMAIQYRTKKKFKNIEVFFDYKKFGPWYAWILPHKGYTLLGTGADPKFIKVNALKKTLDKWCEGRFDMKKAKFEAGIIQDYYTGCVFGKKFLVGDAAGLVAPLQGEGMYAAMLSGIDVARKIINPKYKCVNIAHALKVKNAEEKIIRHMEKHKTLAKIEIEAFAALARFKWFDRKIIENAE